MPANTYVLEGLHLWYECKARPLSVPLEVHEASKLCKHAGDVEEVMVHGVLPGVACLKDLLELTLGSLKNYVMWIECIACP